jgi:hypothetical protein
MVVLLMTSTLLAITAVSRAPVLDSLTDGGQKTGRHTGGEVGEKGCKVNQNRFSFTEHVCSKRQVPWPHEGTEACEQTVGGRQYERRKIHRKTRAHYTLQRRLASPHNKGTQHI